MRLNTRLWSRGVTRSFRYSLSGADSFVRVEESATGGRCSSAVSAVSSFVPVQVHHGIIGSPPSQTPPCGFTAAGSSNVTPRTIPRMLDTRQQQWVLP
jgi:hypothetical protein